MKTEESLLQQACVKWFRLQYPNLRTLLFAVPNGGYRYQATARRLVAEGVVAGVADLLLLVPSHGYHGLCIEMKNGDKGRQSLNQKNWQKKVEEQGYRYIICRDIKNFFVEISKYLQKSL